jgi:YD repeat-containing protein
MAAEGALIAHPELEERLHHPDSYSSAQRLDSATAPTTEVTRMASDGRGRLTAVTPPDAGTHLYGYTSAGQLASYAPPPLVSVAPESWQYSSDLLLASQGHADGQQTVVRRDTFGRVASVVTPWHATDVTYVSATGQVSSLRRSGRQVSSLWDGPLLTSESSTGLAAGGRMTPTSGWPPWPSTASPPPAPTTPTAS